MRTCGYTRASVLAFVMITLTVTGIGVVIGLKIGAKRKGGTTSSGRTPPPLLSPANLPQGKPTARPAPHPNHPAPPRARPQRPQETNPPSTKRPHAPAVLEPPVFLADDDDAMPLRTQFHQYINDMLASDEASTIDTARRLLASDDAWHRSCGAMLLIETGALQDEDMLRLAEDSDPSVLLNAIGWLRDAGQGEQAGTLLEAFDGLPQDREDLLALMKADTLLPAGQRLMLDLIGESLPTAETKSQFFEDVIGEIDLAHSVRLKSALLLRDTTEFAAYRDQINRMADQAPASEWRESLKRLSEQLQGPVEIHTDPPAIGGDDIDERLARPYPTMLEDLALHIEGVLAAQDHFVEEDTATVLKEYVAELGNQPLDPEQQMSLKRLAALADALATKVKE